MNVSMAYSSEHSSGDSNSYEENMLNLERIKRDFPSEHDMRRPPTMDVLEKEQHPVMICHGTHDSSAETGPFQSIATMPQAAPPSRVLRARPNRTANNNPSSGKTTQRIRKKRYEPYERTSNADSDPLTLSKCPYAGCLFECDSTRRDNLNRHVEEVHKKQYKCFCPVCSKGSRRDNCENHIADGHRIKDKCPICNVPFDVKGMLVHFEDPTSTCIHKIRLLSSQIDEDKRHKFIMPAIANVNNDQ